MGIREKQLLKEVIPNVKNATALSDELSAELLGVIRVVSESTDISLAKLVQERNIGNELSLIRQAVVDKKFDHIPHYYKTRQKDLSAELGLVFYKNKVIVPNRMQESILQVVHGDHEGPDKMKDLCDRVYWEAKESDFLEKDNNCMTCFRTGRN